MALATRIAPTHYELDGAHVHMTYETTAVDGRASFSYHDAQRGGLRFSGDEIRIEEAEIGRLVTVTLHTTPERLSTTFTVLLPHVDVGPKHAVPIQAQGITTVHRNEAPGAGRGEVELYKVVELKGMAREFQPFQG
jgi:predicted acyl esterase